ncbi:AAA family ATPase [Pseudonocardia tropica]|uniref:AAA family ATPase n=1 Tax=Pseudonocardia tropica TaxID=681289 RepID=A0ABV1JYR5_9PSEU
MTDQEVPIDIVLRKAETLGLRIQRRSDGYQVQCPAHDDRTPSLGVSEGDDGRALLVCRAHCDTEDVVAGLGLTMADLFPDNNHSPATSSRSSPAAPAEYVYRRPDGSESFKVVRRRGKRFHQQRKVGEHWESGGSPEATSLPYNADKIADAERVMVVEGERDADTVERVWGDVATCNAGGAGKWKTAHAEHLRGKDVVVIPDQDAPGRKHSDQVVRSLRGVARSVRVLHPVQGCKDVTDHVEAGYGFDDLRDENESPATGRRSRITWASEIEPEPVTWAWLDEGQGRIAAGTQVIAAGREGTGKSSFGITMGAKISRGTLPGNLHGTPRRVLYVTVEDSWAHTLVPRLIAAEADLSLIGRFDVVTEEEADGALSLPHDNDLLEAEIIANDVALVVVDPLMSVIGLKIDTHKEREVRSALDPLSRIADRTGAVVLGIAHFNKSSGTDVSNMITASGAFKNVARAIFGFARDDEGRVMTQTKNSLGRDDLPSLSYALTPIEIPTRKGTATSVRFDFTGASARSVGDILREAKADTDPDESAERDFTVKWIRDYLLDQGGSAPFSDVVSAARNVDIPERTLKRARLRAGVTSKRTGFQRGATWAFDEPHSGHRAGGVPVRGPDGPNEPHESPGTAGQGHSGHSGHPSDAPRVTGPVDGPDGAAVCNHCDRSSPYPLINGWCRSCAYPSGTDSPYRED